MLSQLLARHPELESQQDESLRKELVEWRRRGQLGGYVVLIRGDSQPAAVLDLQQWRDLRTQEWWFLELLAEVLHEFRAAHPGAAVPPPDDCGSCQRCGSSLMAAAEAFSAQLAAHLAQCLYATFGEGLGVDEAVCSHLSLQGLSTIDSALPLTSWD